MLKTVLEIISWAYLHPVPAVAHTKDLYLVLWIPVHG
jgi:hypothetical protein